MVQGFKVPDGVIPDTIAVLVDALRRTAGVGHVLAGLAVEDVTRCVVTAVWDTVGDYRRALGDPDVRLAFMRLWESMDPSPGAYEVRATGTADGVEMFDTDLADRRGPGPESG